MTYTFTHSGFEPGRLRTAVVYPCDKASLRAAMDAQAAGLIEPVLIGPGDRLLSISEEAGIDLEHVTIEDVPRSDEAAAYALELALNGDVEAVMQGSLSAEELLRAILVVNARIPLVLASRPDTREARIGSCALALLAAKRSTQRLFTTAAAFAQRPWFPV